ncbi:uncharacterized protein MYCFIDRAFT_179099 [Pseudocercospora fijiensis CIRAD86]|uniref:Uncharacterized protein n=1 Tax=Pseudocercospora fijiensis (strain CIRAD86) TaxID=383855 RepID=M2ZZJ0_PSEFD|nr:uncharacterized protein MYCFIDRAFT_179099 [Pseudocercospora fijiensis CIRAD86]EME77581.1 hypothetical protein MYCFIDRAFT_179099 [Pseudocercospora fijiensis CIRAD86]
MEYVINDFTKPHPSNSQRLSPPCHELCRLRLHYAAVESSTIADDLWLPEAPEIIPFRHLPVSSGLPWRNFIPARTVSRFVVCLSLLSGPHVKLLYSHVLSRTYQVTTAWPIPDILWASIFIECRECVKHDMLHKLRGESTKETGLATSHYIHLSRVAITACSSKHVIASTLNRSHDHLDRSGACSFWSLVNPTCDLTKQLTAQFQYPVNSVSTLARRPSLPGSASRPLGSAVGTLTIHTLDDCALVDAHVERHSNEFCADFLDHEKKDLDDSPVDIADEQQEDVDLISLSCLNSHSPLLWEAEDIPGVVHFILLPTARRSTLSFLASTLPFLLLQSCLSFFFFCSGTPAIVSTRSVDVAELWMILNCGYVLKLISSEVERFMRPKSVPQKTCAVTAFPARFDESRILMATATDILRTNVHMYICRVGDEVKSSSGPASALIIFSSLHLSGATRCKQRLVQHHCINNELDALKTCASDPAVILASSHRDGPLAAIISGTGISLPAARTREDLGSTFRMRLRYLSNDPFGMDNLQKARAAPEKSEGGFANVDIQHGDMIMYDIDKMISKSHHAGKKNLDMADQCLFQFTDYMLNTNAIADQS